MDKNFCYPLGRALHGRVSPKIQQTEIRQPVFIQQNIMNEIEKSSLSGSRQFGSLFVDDGLSLGTEQRPRTMIKELDENHQEAPKTTGP